jgi:hypothetical protein
MFTRGRSVTAAIGIALALSFGAAPVSAIAATTAQVTLTIALAASNTPADASQAALIRWLPYDSFKITSAGNCTARMNALKALAPDIKHWKCELAGYTQTCPSKPYWFVYAGYQNLRVAEEAAAALESSSTALKSAAKAC